MADIPAILAINFRLSESRIQWLYPADAQIEALFQKGPLLRQTMRAERSVSHLPMTRGIVRISNACSGHLNFL
jgi:hypothetical protein